jgi:hypothetical protein
MGCRKCGCTWFCPNPVSAIQKLYSGSEATLGYNGPAGKVGVTIPGMPGQDNKSDQVAYRNCTCGHHWNYH